MSGVLALVVAAATAAGAVSIANGATTAPTTRRAAAAAGAASASATNTGAVYSPVVPGMSMEFPRDYGSHPEFRTEWWYVTGWLATSGGRPLGFQITFFRTRPDVDARNPSAFTAHQLLVAHCALSDPERGRLWQDQRVRRAGLGLAEAAVGDAKVWIDDWRLERNGDTYQARAAAEGFALDLDLVATQAPMQNGQSGFSRKGPAPQSASYYYSIPHLRVAGHITRDGKSEPVTGEAWFDHEWSSDYLDAQAIGWDWIGIDLDDGGALMAYRIRGPDGGTRWAGGTLASPDGQAQKLEPGDVAFEPGRRWVSPRTGIAYPVTWRVRAGTQTFDLEPLMDDQENDTRLTTGAIYWEGAVRALQGGRGVGRGYLELTGYGERLRLR
jgi:predicted secreted hydrolase